MLKWVKKNFNYNFFFFTKFCKHLFKSWRNGQNRTAIGEASWGKHSGLQVYTINGYFHLIRRDATVNYTHNTTASHNLHTVYNKILQNGISLAPLQLDQTSSPSCDFSWEWHKFYWTPNLPAWKFLLCNGRWKKETKWIFCLTVLVIVFFFTARSDYGLG